MIVRDKEDDDIYPDFVTELELLQGSNLALHDQDFYGKTGRSNFSAGIFEDMQIKYLVSCNSMLAAYELNGEGEAALKVFEMLKSSGLGLPNAINFTNVLSAWSHSKLIAKGLDIYRSMEKSHSIEPNMDHYACVVAMLAKSRKIDDVVSFIELMLLPPGAGVWSSLLVGCGMYTRVDVAETAAKWLSVLDPQVIAWRVTLSSVYVSAGRWGDVAKVREEMKDSSVPEAGCSTVLVQGDTLDFSVNNTRHPKSGTVYEVLDTLMKHDKGGILARRQNSSMYKVVFEMKPF